MNYRESPEALKGRWYLTIFAEKTYKFFYIIWFVVSGWLYWFNGFETFRHVSCFYELFRFCCFLHLIIIETL